MKTVCAWCGLVMAEGDPPISHGMCPSCRSSFASQEGTSLQAFIDSFSFPVFVVNHSLAPIGINKSLAETSKLEGNTVAESSMGAIVECDNSNLPGGCGQTVHCSGCVLRKTVTETNETGDSCSMVPAKLTTNSKEVSMYVSTLKLDGRIYVKIEKVSNDPT